MTKLQRTVLTASILASFVGAIDGFVVTVALPTISQELGGGLVTQQWVVNAYLISLGALMLLAGSLSDIFGRKRILVVGLVGFGLTSVLCAVAPSALFLIIARGFQGVAGALLVPSSLALIVSHFKGEAQGKAIGTWTAWTSIAPLTGPILGGLLVDYVSWRFIFAINVPIILYTLWLARRLDVPKEIKAGKVDVLGAVLGVVGLGGVVFAFIEQERFGWTAPIILIPLVIGLITSVTFLLYERRVSHPMLPLELFRQRNFSVGNIATIFIYAALALSSFIITIYLQQAARFTALEAGMAFLPVTLIMFFLSSRIGRLSGKYGPRLFMTIGPIVMALGFLWMLQAIPPVNYWLEILPGVIIFGIGLSMMVAPLTSTVLGAIPEARAGIASAVNNAISRVAGLIAVAAIGLVVGSSLSGVAEFQRGILAIAFLAFIGGIVSAVGIRNKKKKTDTSPKATAQ